MPAGVVQAGLVTVAGWLTGFHLPAAVAVQPSLAASAAVALAAVLFAWGAAAAVAFWIYTAVGLDRLGRTAVRALRTAVPAMWFPPATLLVSSMTLAGAVAGALLIANSTRMLIARGVPHRFLRRRPERTAPMFRYPAWSTLFTHETAPLIAGSAAVQGAFLTIAAGFPLAGACLLSSGIAICTWHALRAGAFAATAKAESGRTLVSAFATLLLAFGLSVAQFGTDEPPGAGASVFETAKSAWERIAVAGAPAKRTVQAARPGAGAVRLIAPGRDLVPGVILRPDAKRNSLPAVRVPRAASPVLALSLSEPLEFPFTGEYHLFPASSQRVQADSAVYSGTPLDAVFLNTGGGPVETQAVQEFRPSIDFTNCGKLLVTLVNADRSLGSATVFLAGASGVAELKPEIFGFDSGPDETLEFPIPSDQARGLVVRTLRIGFKLVDPGRRTRSAKIALQSFRLVPRGT